MEKEKIKEILTIAGRRVEVKFCERGPCDKCCFFSPDCGCPYDMPCYPYWGPDYFAYFDPAEETELEAEISRFEDELHGFEGLSRADCLNIARHFAKWGAEHLKR